MITGTNVVFIGRFVKVKSNESETSTRENKIAEQLFAAAETRTIVNAGTVATIYEDSTKFYDPKVCQTTILNSRKRTTIPEIGVADGVSE